MNKEEKDRRREETLFGFFSKRWNEIEQVVEYDHTWEIPLSPQVDELAKANGDIGYNLRGIHTDPAMQALPIGQPVKTIDDYGRKIIIVNTRLGTMLVYIVSADLRGKHIALSASNPITASGLRPAIGSLVDLAAILGSPNGISDVDKRVYRNIGEWMELTAKMLNDPTYRPRSIKLIKKTTK